jgi:hypothetical protein
MLVINDYGRAKQSMISVSADGKCSIAGIAEPFPTLQHLINVMRMRRQYVPSFMFVNSVAAVNINNSLT